MITEAADLTKGIDFEGIIAKFAKLKSRNAVTNTKWRREPKYEKLKLICKLFCYVIWVLCHLFLLIYYL